MEGQGNVDKFITMDTNDPEMQRLLDELGDVDLKNYGFSEEDLGTNNSNNNNNNNNNEETTALKANERENLFKSLKNVGMENELETKYTQLDEEETDVDTEEDEQVNTNGKNVKKALFFEELNSVISRNNIQTNQSKPSKNSTNNKKEIVGQYDSELISNINLYYPWLTSHKAFITQHSKTLKSQFKKLIEFTYPKSDPNSTTQRECWKRLLQDEKPDFTSNELELLRSPRADASLPSNALAFLGFDQKLKAYFDKETLIDIFKSNTKTPENIDTEQKTVYNKLVEILTNHPVYFAILGKQEGLALDLINDGYLDKNFFPTLFHAGFHAAEVHARFAIVALQHNCLKVFNALFEKDIDLNYIQKNTNTVILPSVLEIEQVTVHHDSCLLFEVIKGGHADILEKLLRRDCKLIAVNEDNQVIIDDEKKDHVSHLLILAAQYGHANIAKVLFDKNLKQELKGQLQKLREEPCSKGHAQHVAGANGHVDFLREYINSFDDKSRYTEAFRRVEIDSIITDPFKEACKHNKPAVVKFYFQTFYPELFKQVDHVDVKLTYKKEVKELIEHFNRLKEFTNKKHPNTTDRNRWLGQIFIDAYRSNNVLVMESLLTLFTPGQCEAAIADSDINEVAPPDKKAIRHTVRLFQREQASDEQVIDANKVYDKRDDSLTFTATIIHQLTSVSEQMIKLLTDNFRLDSLFNHLDVMSQQQLNRVFAAACQQQDISFIRQCLLTKPKDNQLVSLEPLNAQSTSNPQKMNQLYLDALHLHTYWNTEENRSKPLMVLLNTVIEQQDTESLKYILPVFTQERLLAEKDFIHTCTDAITNNKFAILKTIEKKVPIRLIIEKSNQAIEGQDYINIRLGTIFGGMVKDDLVDDIVKNMGLDQPQQIKNVAQIEAVIAEAKSLREILATNQDNNIIDHLVTAIEKNNHDAIKIIMKLYPADKLLMSENFLQVCYDKLSQNQLAEITLIEGKIALTTLVSQCNQTLKDNQPILKVIVQEACAHLSGEKAISDDEVGDIIDNKAPQDISQLQEFIGKLKKLDNHFQQCKPSQKDIPALLVLDIKLASTEGIENIVEVYPEQKLLKSQAFIEACDEMLKNQRFDLINLIVKHVDINALFEQVFNHRNQSIVEAKKEIGKVNLDFLTKSTNKDTVHPIVHSLLVRKDINENNLPALVELLNNSTLALEHFEYIEKSSTTALISSSQGLSANVTDKTPKKAELVEFSQVNPCSLQKAWENNKSLLDQLTTPVLKFYRKVQQLQKDIQEKSNNGLYDNVNTKFEEYLQSRSKAIEFELTKGVNEKYEELKKFKQEHPTDDLPKNNQTNGFYMI